MTAQCRYTQASSGATSHALASSFPGAKLTCGRVAAGLGVSTVQKNPKFMAIAWLFRDLCAMNWSIQIQCLWRGICINKVVNHKT